MHDSLITRKNRLFSQSSIRKRLLRSSSEQNSQKQLTRNSTMTSFRPKLERLIQEGKVEQILNSDKHSKSKLIYSTTINDMEKQLADSKKSLSVMNLKAKSKQFNINKLKNQITKLERENSIIKASNEAINKIYDTSLSFLDSKRETKQNIEWVEKSYIHIKQRLLKDQYFHKVEYDNKYKKLEAQKCRAEFLQKTSLSINKQRRELDKAVSQAKQITNEETFLKNELIDILSQDRQEKQFLNNLRVQKHQKQAQISQLSAWVIEKQELNKYLNILYTHRILSQIVRTKNINLMQKYSEVQAAYLHIKSNTNIIQFQKILKRMQEQDSIYDITVKKVSDLESELEAMQMTLQKAKKQKNKILSRQGIINKHQKGYYQGIEKDKYQLMLSQKQKFQHRITQDDILRQRVFQWVSRLREKLSIFQIEGQKVQDVLAICVDRLKGRKKQSK